ncbi:hypothetical protein C5O27_22500 (plasmid) [Gordonia alkanivorans]|nr:hypothetical protein C5O27_22500 [Gordonia alkanivorans]
MDKLINQFQQQMDDLYVHADVALYLWDDRKKMKAAGFETTLETKHLELIDESSLVQAVVAWQLFASRWITDALVHDTSVLASELAKHDRAELSIARGVRVYPQVKELAAHSSRETIARFLEKDAKFLTVNYEKHWLRYSDILAPTFRDRVKRLKHHEHYLIILLTAKLRNASAHRSPSALAELKSVLIDPDLGRFDKRHKVALGKSTGVTAQGIGHYLASEMANPYGGSNTRLHRHGQGREQAAAPRSGAACSGA